MGLSLASLPRPRWRISMSSLSNPAFSPLPDRCFRMVQSRQLQATHCAEAPTFTVHWFSGVIAGSECGPPEVTWTV